MPFISLLLVFKIVVTGALTAFPFLLLPDAKLAAMTGVENGGRIFRLYGIAILALLVGYASGLQSVAAGQFPWGIVAMGLVSNAGAALFLFGSGAWRKAKPISFAVLTVAIGLVIAGLKADWAMKPLW